MKKKRSINKDAYCPFCNKNNNDYILQSTHFAVMYNISPILPGHVLVIPREHKESLFELTDSEISEFMILGRDAARLPTRVFETEAFNWAIQEREPAGQSVAHLHITRYPAPWAIWWIPVPGFRNWNNQLRAT